jgi:hypothetical protein
MAMGQARLWLRNDHLGNIKEGIHKSSVSSTLKLIVPVFEYMSVVNTVCGEIKIKSRHLDRIAVNNGDKRSWRVTPRPHHARRDVSWPGENDGADRLQRIHKLSSSLIKRVFL